MKIKTLNKEQREICQKAYKKQKDHFHNKSFTDLYLDFCKATNYEDTSAENFMVYTKIYGGNSAQKNHQFQSSSNSGSRMVTHNRRMNAADSEKLTHAFIEDHRVEMMRRMTHANRG
jgi:hypothetical protein